MVSRAAGWRWRPRTHHVDGPHELRRHPHDKQELADALHNVHYAGMCGLLNFAAGPAPGVAIVPPVGVQWKASSGKFPSR